MTPEPGIVISGKYRLKEVLATGGMGSVWSAHHQKLDSTVAIKFMDPVLAGSDEARGRFEREAKAAAKLRSPHVVQVLDYGVEEDTPFIVMELLEGEDLRSRIKTRGHLGLSEAATILKHACKALRLAADAGIVHRDLKPGNIFLARSGDDEVAKILDFGVAKATRSAVSDNTSTGVLLGSPHYMSPEQARGLELDPRSDLFSMGVILFMMVTGERPFSGEDVGDIIVRICTEPVPAASSIQPELPEEFDRFFERALARDRAKRFQSAQAMAAEFATIVAAHMGLAFPESSQSGSLRLPGSPPLPPDSHPTPSHPALTPSQGSSVPEDELPTISGAVSAPAVTPGDDLAADATPSETLQSQRYPQIPASNKAGTLTLATQSVALQRPRSNSNTTLWAAIGAAIVAGGIVYLLVGRDSGESASRPTSALEQAADSEASAAPDQADSGEPSVSDSAEPPHTTSAPAGATATASATATAEAVPTNASPRPPPPPRRPPRPPAQPTSTTPKGKHPIFGI